MFIVAYAYIINVNNGSYYMTSHDCYSPIVQNESMYLMGYFPFVTDSTRQVIRVDPSLPNKWSI